MKGQTSMIEILFLALAVTVSLSLLGMQTLSSAQLEDKREEYFYTNSLLLNVSDRFLDSIDSYFCGNGTSVDIGTYLNSTIKPGYDYIFYAHSPSKELHVWNKYGAVEIEDIAIASLDFKGSCGSIDIGPMLGIWPDYKKVREVK